MIRTHACIGRCGRTIRRRRPMCPLCWRRVPRRYRDAITGTDRTRFTTWTAAVEAAAAWFTHHPIATRHRVAVHWTDTSADPWRNLDDPVVAAVDACPDQRMPG